MPPGTGNAPRAAAVVVAAGASRRMAGAAVAAGRSALRKPFLELAGVPVVERSVAALDRAATVVEVVLVAHPDDVAELERWCAERPAFAKVVAVVPGGAERGDSVRAGVFWTAFTVDVIAVHDAARPLVRPDLVDRVVAAAHAHGAALLASRVADTLKESDDGLAVARTLDRARLWAAQTPQAFRARPFRALVERAAREGFSATDDAALWERYEGPVRLVEGPASNPKLTAPEDLALCEALLARGAPAAEERA